MSYPSRVKACASETTVQSGPATAINVRDVGDVVRVTVAVMGPPPVGDLDDTSPGRSDRERGDSLSPRLSDEWAEPIHSEETPCAT
ncbi:hypothetical protein GCM10009539_40980 [Cryptosporangium japonicum]|uniref:Uncharacterized protein n=1 Tax=Cryptosporangium japonicum TaxID=80872 RepID=A0ABP3E7B3_9ACTN